MIQVNITGTTEEVIKRRLTAGEFGTPEEVIEAAVQRFEQSAAPTMESLQAKIQEGLDDEAAGRVAPFDIEEIKAALRERIEQRQNA